MKLIKLNLFFLFCFFSVRTSAQIISRVVPESIQNSKTSYSIPGSHLLREKEQEIAKLVTLHPEVLRKSALNKTPFLGKYLLS